MSTETKWTPGPWSTEEQISTSGRSSGWIITHNNGRIGWSSFATAEPNEGETAPYPIGKANAHLIAAAPELYEALENERERLEEELNDICADTQEGGSHSRHTKRINEINFTFAALAKALPSQEVGNG